MLHCRCWLVAALIVSGTLTAPAQKPTTAPDVVFAEKDGLVAVEAEHFVSQTATEKRAFYLVTSEQKPTVSPDGDPPHVAGASGGAYLEILPDTRRTHGDKLIKGENFSPEPGRMAVLTYNVQFSTPGRYYVWVRAHSTGSEDNGLHVGMDGKWPASGQRLQWCEGKQNWRWESKQRTEKQHCGEPFKIFLDIEEPGKHQIHFSMREDGFEFDKWLMTTERTFSRPSDAGPASTVYAGEAPKTFPFVKPPKPTPPEPAAQPRPVTQSAPNALSLPARAFSLESTKFYLDRDKWAAINPDRNKSAKTSLTFPFPTGKYHVTLQAVGESDGRSTYHVGIDDEKLGEFVCPLSDQMYEEGKKFQQTWKDVLITEGAMVNIEARIGTKDGEEFSRARWAGFVFQPADTRTKQAVKNANVTQHFVATERPRSGSPTKPVSTQPLIQPRKPDGNGNIEVTGNLKTWHKITLTLNGPFAHEQDNAPNPFTDHRMSVLFTHNDDSNVTYQIPGFFAADGNAANSSAESGTKWRVHFAPDRPGEWKYSVHFFTGKNAALDSTADAEPVTSYDGESGTIKVAASDKSGRDLRAKGRLSYVGKRYLQHLGSKEYFLKAGADAPETLLGYADFDNTEAKKPKVPLKTFQPHVNDWQPGDPTWKQGKGKGLIGAINYLSGTGCNAFSFLTYNAGGDGDNVWPFIHRDDKLHYDCSKLDQWGIVFDHGTNRGMYLHFKMQETENDDHRRGKGGNYVPECLDGGNLGPQRKLYCRELIARFGHNLALNWNLGEENTQSTQQQQEMINYIADLDAYDHNIVIHTFPNEQEKVYRPLLGDASKLTGLSLQNSNIRDTHSQTVKWVRASTEAGKPWVVAFDESGSAAHGQCPDLGYKGFDGKDRTGKMIYTPEEVRRQTLWGHLMGGGGGVEYYFGYQFVENDLVCEDWRSRDQSWQYCAAALKILRECGVAIEKTKPADELVGNDKHDNSVYCLAEPEKAYLVYLPYGGEAPLDLSKASGQFQLNVFNPRTGETTKRKESVDGGKRVELSAPDKTNDWLLVLKRQ